MRPHGGRWNHLLLFAMTLSLRLAQVYSADQVEMGKDDVPGEVLAQIRIKNVRSLRDDPCTLTIAERYGKTDLSAFNRMPMGNFSALPMLNLKVGKPVTFDGIEKACIALQCAEKSVGGRGRTRLEDVAEQLVDQGDVPDPTGRKDLDKVHAFAILLMKFGYLDDAIKLFTQVVMSEPKVSSAYYGRGMTYIKKDLYKYGDKAIEDFDKATYYNPTYHEAYERKAEVEIILGKYSQGIKDVKYAMKGKVTAHHYFMKGHIEFMQADFYMAERSLRRALILAEDTPHLEAMFHLGTALYFKGKMRNAAEVYKDILKDGGNIPEVLASLGETYKEMGNKKEALKYLNMSLQHDPTHPLTLQVLASLYYNSGDLHEAVKVTQKCLAHAPNEHLCQHFDSLAHTALGKFYKGVKAATKVIVYHKPATMIRAKAEFIRAHYVREYARYLHHKLDSPLSELEIEKDFPPKYRNMWVKGDLYLEKGFKEQPGIQPHISDVETPDPSWYKPAVRELICKAAHVGDMMQVTLDGFHVNPRINLAMGLAAIQTAQMAETMWLHNSGKTSNTDWEDLVTAAIQWRRLVDPNQAVVWMDVLSISEDVKIPEPFIIRGQTLNVRLSSYFDVIFKLARTMIIHYYGGTDEKERAFLGELEKIGTPDDLLSLSKRYDLADNGFAVSTEVPSIQLPNTPRLDGAILTLHGEGRGRVLFSMNTMASKRRSDAYIAEINHVMQYIKQKVRDLGLKQAYESDHILEMILHLAYYMYNWVPISRGSSVVTYTVTLGLIMSLGREVNNRVPYGKLLNIEAQLAGAPDIFTAVLKQWLTFKKIQRPVSTLPKVFETFPTTRSALEVLNMGATWCQG